MTAILVINGAIITLATIINLMAWLHEDEEHDFWYYEALIIFWPLIATIKLTKGSWKAVKHALKN